MEFISHALMLFHKGGPVMYFLLLCSLAVVAIAAERFAYFQNMTTDTAAFLVKLQPLLDRQRIADALQLCEASPKLIHQLTAEGLRVYQRGGNMENALSGAAMLAASRLREYLNYLSAIVTLAPLFGLLGTVIGMINSFSVFNVQAGQPMAITGGVGEALVATAAGLSVAALALIVHTYFAHRLDTIVTDMEQTSTLIIHGTSAKPIRRDAHEVA